MNKKIKIIAYYLPQYHPIPLNDKFWGPGFTEWHNVAQARPLFRGHVQPKLPGELGFYDLRLEETRIEQARLAKEYGIYGFCYWHYWFSGERILNRPADEVLKSGKPDFPFCLGWANETWSGVWYGSPESTIIKQEYPEGDAEKHYDVLREYFLDTRYIKKKGCPLFYVYKPKLIPKYSNYIGTLRRLAKKDGFKDLFVVGTWLPNKEDTFQNLNELDIEAGVITNISGRYALTNTEILISKIKDRIKKITRIEIGPKKLPYLQAIESMLPDLKNFEFPAYNCVVPNWDNTPRSGRRGLVLTGSTPRLFRKALEIALRNVAKKYPEPLDEQYVFLKSWNEWAEGNYLEPDQIHGREYLNQIKGVLLDE